MLQILLTLVRARVNDSGWSWVEDTVRACASGIPPGRLARAYTAVPRRTGGAPLALSEAERAAVAAVAPALSMARWSVDDAVRAALVLAAVDGVREADRGFALAIACYENGDAREQQSWLRAIALLPDPARFLPAAIDACRTSIVPLFESIACDNPYPARHFPERNFNQMVLKALFNSIAIERISGLASRFNEELSRMADDYVSEREAAGRTVPVDIWLALVPCVGDGSLERVRRYLEGPDPAHRRWASAGLAHRKAPGLKVLER